MKPKAQFLKELEKYNKEKEEKAWPSVQFSWNAYPKSFAIFGDTQSLVTAANHWITITFFFAFLVFSFLFSFSSSVYKKQEN